MIEIALHVYGCVLFAISIIAVRLRSSLSAHIFCLILALLTQFSRQLRCSYASDLAHFSRIVEGNGHLMNKIFELEQNIVVVVGRICRYSQLKLDFLNLYIYHGKNAFFFFSVLENTCYVCGCHMSLTTANNRNPTDPKQVPLLKIAAASVVLQTVCLSISETWSNICVFAVCLTLLLSELCVCVCFRLMHFITIVPANFQQTREKHNEIQ